MDLIARHSFLLFYLGKVCETVDRDFKRFRSKDSSSSRNNFAKLSSACVSIYWKYLTTMAEELPANVVAFIETVVESNNKEVKRIEDDIYAANKNVQRLRKLTSTNEKIIQELKDKISAFKPINFAIQAAMSESIVHHDLNDNSTNIEETVKKEQLRTIPEDPMYLEDIEIDGQDDHNEIERKLKAFHNSINWSEKQIKLTKVYDLHDGTLVFSMLCPQCEMNFMVSQKSTDIYENHVINSHIF